MAERKKGRGRWAAGRGAEEQGNWPGGTWTDIRPRGAEDGAPSGATRNGEAPATGPGGAVEDGPREEAAGRRRRPGHLRRRSGAGGARGQKRRTAGPNGKATAHRPHRATKPGRRPGRGETRPPRGRGMRGGPGETAAERHRPGHLRKAERGRGSTRAEAPDGGADPGRRRPRSPTGRRQPRRMPRRSETGATPGPRQRGGCTQSRDDLYRAGMIWTRRGGPSCRRSCRGRRRRQRAIRVPSGDPRGVRSRVGVPLMPQELPWAPQ